MLSADALKHLKYSRINHGTCTIDTYRAMPPSFCQTPCKPNACPNTSIPFSLWRPAAIDSGQSGYTHRPHRRIQGPSQDDSSPGYNTSRTTHLKRLSEIFHLGGTNSLRISHTSNYYNTVLLPSLGSIHSKRSCRQFLEPTIAFPWGNHQQAA